MDYVCGKRCGLYELNIYCLNKSLICDNCDQYCYILFSGTWFVGRNTMQVCLNQCCLLDGFQELLLLGGCQTSLVESVFYSLLSLGLLLLHLQALLFLYCGK